jgi:hypothetical protein
LLEAEAIDSDLLPVLLKKAPTQKELIQFADGLQRLFEIAILFDRLLNQRNLLGAQTHLAGLSTGIE